MTRATEQLNEPPGRTRLSTQSITKCPLYPVSWKRRCGIVTDSSRNACQCRHYGCSWCHTFIRPERRLKLRNSHLYYRRKTRRLHGLRVFSPIRTFFKTTFNFSDITGTLTQHLSLFRTFTNGQKLTRRWSRYRKPPKSALHPFPGKEHRWTTV